jgi:hypothetical protein
MVENSKNTIEKTVLFEKTGQKISIEVSLVQCEKKDYKKLIPILFTLFNNIKADLEI